MVYPVDGVRLGINSILRCSLNSDCNTVAGFLPISTEVNTSFDSGGAPSKHETEEVSGDCSVVDVCDN